VIIDFARRAHDHNWEMDPITRSLLDTDFYKLLMLQFIWKNFPRTRATFTLINRTTSVRLGEVVGIQQLQEQLEATRRLRFRKSELVWLAGNTFHGRRGIFEPHFSTGSSTTFNSLNTSFPSTMVNSSFSSKASGPEPRCGRSTPSRKLAN